MNGVGSAGLLSRADRNEIMHQAIEITFRQNISSSIGRIIQYETLLLRLLQIVTEKEKGVSRSELAMKHPCFVQYRDCWKRFRDLVAHGDWIMDGNSTKAMLPSPIGLEQARPELCITHSPGSMLLTDIPNSKLAVM